MKFLTIILASIPGTAVMTLVMYLLSYMSDVRLKSSRILGTMLTNRTTPEGGLSQSRSAVYTGMLVNYTLGAVFAVGYLMLWDAKIGEPSLMYSIAYGMGSGIIAVLLWNLFLTWRQNPPHIPIKVFYLALILGYVVFAVVTVHFYRYLAEYVFHLDDF